MSSVTGFHSQNGPIQNIASTVASYVVFGIVGSIVVPTTMATGAVFGTIIGIIQGYVITIFRERLTNYVSQENPPKLEIGLAVIATLISSTIIAQLITNALGYSISLGAASTILLAGFGCLALVLIAALAAALAVKTFVGLFCRC